METINKLLKKQAPKVSKKAAAAAAADGTPEEEGSKVNPVFIRWTSTKEGSRVAIPDEMVDGPAGRVFQKGTGGLSSGKMVEEVA
jgi:Ino eighty subunit 2